MFRYLEKGRVQPRLVVLSILFILAILGIVFTARGQSMAVAGMDRLISPRPLGFVAARRMAVSLTANVVYRSRAQIWGTTAASHVQAIASHLAVADRPVRDSIHDLINEGETVQGLRRRWHLRDSDLTRLNEGLDPEHLEPGTSLCVWRRDPENPARSCYRPNRGRLQNGELMPAGEGWVVRDIHVAYGVHQTIDGLVHAIREVLAQYPGGQDLMIADISSRNGGRLRPHRSHQSGRDADVTYYRHLDGDPTFSRARLDELDVERNWTLIRTLLLDHDIEYMFMSRSIQEALYSYAESIGEHPAFLDEVFEYGPRGHRNHRAPIRFARGHADHVHIRFGCSDLDYLCRPSR